MVFSSEYVFVACRRRRLIMYLSSPLNYFIKTSKIILGL